MRSFIGNGMEEHGPMIKIKIVAPLNVGGMYPSGKAAPVVEALALIDTGASASSIPMGTGKQLGLTPVDKMVIVGFNGPNAEPSYRYRVRIILPNAEGEVIADEEVYEDHDVPYTCVIGRDILKHGVLFYDGTNNSFSLTL